MGIPEIRAAKKLGSVAGAHRHPGRMKQLMTLLERLASWRHRNADGRTVGVGTVRKVAGGRQAFIDVLAVHALWLAAV